MKHAKMELIGKQKNLDRNKNGKIDSEDLRMIRENRMMAKGGYVTDIDEVVASSDLKEELKSKMKEGDEIVAFAYTDYGGSFDDKVAIEYFKENHPKNIVFENSGYNGQNGIVFGEVAKDFLEETEDYPLGYEDMESFYYDMQNAQEEKDFKLFLSDIKNKYTVKKDALDWLMENKSGYYSIGTDGLDFSYSELENELEEEGLIKPKKMADGGMMDDGGSVKRANNSLLLKYANFEDNWHINLLELNPYRNQSGLRYKGENKYAVTRVTPKSAQEMKKWRKWVGIKDQLFEFKTLEDAENKFNKLVELSKTFSPIRSSMASGGEIDGGGKGSEWAFWAGLLGWGVLSYIGINKK